MRRFVIGSAIVIAVAAVIVGRQLLYLGKFVVVNPKKGELSTFVIASGKIKAEREANLSFKTTGRVVYLVEENQRVKQGQRVASLDKQSLVKQREAALRDYYVQRLELEQLMDDYDNVIANDTEKRNKETKQAKLEKSVLGVEQIQQDINNSALYAPFDGIVLEVNGEENEWTSAFSSVPLVVLVDPSSFYFDAEIKEEDIGRIKVGDAAELTFYAFPGRKFAGAVTEIGKQTKEDEYGETVIPVKVKLAENKKEIEQIDLIGLEGDIKIRKETKQNVLTLPKRAVILKGQKPHVLIKINSLLVEEKPVELGIEDLNVVEVKEGINSKDQVLLPKIALP